MEVEILINDICLMAGGSKMSFEWIYRCFYCYHQPEGVSSAIYHQGSNTNDFLTQINVALFISKPLVWNNGTIASQRENLTGKIKLIMNVTIWYVLNAAPLQSYDQCIKDPRVYNLLLFYCLHLITRNSLCLILDFCTHFTADVWRWKS